MHKIRSFATPIKNMLKVMGLTHEELYDPKLAEEVIPDFGKSPREIMQLLGTEFARNMIDENVWVTALMRQLNDEDNYVIDDVSRFPNGSSRDSCKRWKGCSRGSPWRSVKKRQPYIRARAQL